jgi:hypothetical protein
MCKYILELKIEYNINDEDTKFMKDITHLMLIFL